MNEISSHLERLRESFLWAAAKGGRIQECSSLLELGADINWIQHDPGGDGDTPLLVATRNGHKDVVVLLLAHEADPYHRGKGENTALHLAASRGDEELCALFRDKCSPFSKNEEGLTPIDIAIDKGFFMLAEQMKNMVCSDERKAENTDELYSDAGSGEYGNVFVMEGSRSGRDGDGGNRDVSDSSQRRESNLQEERFDTASMSSQEESHHESQASSSDDTETRQHIRLRDTNVDISADEINLNGNNDVSISSEEESAGWELDSQENNNDDLEEQTGGNFNNDDHSSLTENSTTSTSDYYSFSEESSGFSGSDTDSTENAADAYLKKYKAQVQARAKYIAIFKTKLAAAHSSEKHILPESTYERMAVDLMSRYENLRKEKGKLQNELRELSGLNVEGKSVKELEEVENRLRTALNLVVEEKEKAIKKILLEEEKKHVCVVCQEEPKCVLLMPCRHLCVCKECSRRGELMTCPLCRVSISQRIDVFS